MRTVKDALARKSGTLIHVRSGDMVIEALHQMRDNRVRSVLVIDDDVLVGIVTQGDCAMKVLLPGLDAKQTPVGELKDPASGDALLPLVEHEWESACNFDRDSPPCSISIQCKCCLGSHYGNGRLFEKLIRKFND